MDVLWWHLKCPLATLDYLLMDEREGMKGDKGLAWCCGFQKLCSALWVDPGRRGMIAAFAAGFPLDLATLGDHLFLA